MQLLTDYPQWYDMIFDDAPLVFHLHALTRGGLTKRQQFQLFAKMRLRSPPHGLVNDLVQRFVNGTDPTFHPPPTAFQPQCVVYVDELAHRTLGKVRVPMTDAVRQYPDHYASLYIPQEEGPLAYRLVRFGRLEFSVKPTGSCELFV